MTDITDNIQNYIDNFSKNEIAETGKKYIKFQDDSSSVMGDRIFTSSIILGDKIESKNVNEKFNIYDKYSDQELNNHLKNQDIPDKIIEQANRDQKINVLKTLANIDTENLNNKFNFEEKNDVKIKGSHAIYLYIPLDKNEGEALSKQYGVERYNPTELLKLEIEAKEVKDLSINNNLDNGKNYNQLLENIKQENITEDKENSISNVHTLGKSISVLM